MKKIVKAALMHGVKFFAASHRAFNPLAKVHLEALKEVASKDSMEVKIISCVDVPLRIGEKRVDDFQRWKTHLEYEALKYGN